jgi:hypothetical protein
MKSYRFYKDEYGWFVDIPEWEGDVWDLQMVSGADTFCDIMAQGENEIYVTLSTEPFDDCEVLEFEQYGRLEAWELGEGAWYVLRVYKNQFYDLRMWLCNVTKFVLGELPNRIYFK